MQRTPQPGLIPRRPARGGFSYVEMVLVALATGIIAAAATPRFAATLGRYRAQSAAQRIQADLAYARRCAISGSTSVTVRFSTTEHSCAILGVKSLDRVGQTYQTVLTDAPYSSQLAAVAVGGDSDLVFNLHGRPDTGGVITVQSGTQQATVTIDAESGRVTVP